MDSDIQSRIMAEPTEGATTSTSDPLEVPVTVIPAATGPSPSWGPVQPEERIALIDVVRGLALFGIIAANMRGFAGPLTAYFHPDLVWKTRADIWVQAFVDTFIQGKFITLFAFLFGVGFALQFSRAEARGSRFAPIYRRRLFALILIGFIHQLLFWWGDILVSYGLGGFLLILFRKMKSKRVLTWALALMLGPCIAVPGIVLFRQIRPPSPQKLQQVEKQALEREKKTQVELRETIETYQKRSYAEVVVYRLRELARENSAQPGVVAYTLPIFLMGLLVFRLGIFQDPAGHRALLRKALFWGLVIGIPANIADTWLQFLINAQTPTGGPTSLTAAMIPLRLFGRPALSMAYGAGIALLFLNEGWRRRMMPFGAIGRTALSNYLLQSLVCTTIFAGYGLGRFFAGGLFAQVHLAKLFVLSIAIYLVQAPLSQWWLTRFRFGPAEWLWRTMTYGKAPGMKRLEPTLS